MAMKDLESELSVDACGSETRAILDAGGSLESLRIETLEDHINLVNRLRMKLLENGGAEAIIMRLNRDAATDPNLFFRVRRDDIHRVLGIFWCDSRMKDDYKRHGDVIIFGMSYNINKYCLICAPFVGVINHCTNVMYGCAFIADETTDSFVWLLKTFKEAMNNKSPAIIFSEHNFAIGNAIRHVFPEAKHVVFDRRTEQKLENREVAV